MKPQILSILFTLYSLVGFAQNIEGETISSDQGDIVIRPILHATMAISFDGKIIYTDPYGGTEVFEGIPKPDLILITDIHGDHLNLKTLQALNLQSTIIVAPKAVADKLPEEFTNVILLANGETKEVMGLTMTGVPMYNLPEEEQSRHTKGRGNGYVVNLGGKRIYISGDTEDIPEMRALKDIDVAFVCMNQPYTMTVAAAADAVLAFKPKIVYPFHYRGKGGFSDVSQFKKLVSAGDSAIDVRLIEWYPNK